MKFFYKETTSFKIISLIEEIILTKKFINVFIILIQFTIFDVSTRLKIKLNTNEDLFIKLFKERFYLDQLNEKFKIKSSGVLTYEIINGVIIAYINYDVFKINIEYSLSNDNYIIFITAPKGTNFNINKKNLENKQILSISKSILYIIFNDIYILLYKIIMKYFKKEV